MYVTQHRLQTLAATVRDTIAGTFHDGVTLSVSGDCDLTAPGEPYGASFIGVAWHDGPTDAEVRHRLPEVGVQVVLRRRLSVPGVMLGLLRHPVEGTDPWEISFRTPATLDEKQLVQRLVDSWPVQDALRLGSEVLPDESGYLDRMSNAQALRNVARGVLRVNVPGWN